MINNKKIMAVITARKGSKGIPGKNFRLLNGKPLFLWSVCLSMNSKYIDAIIVSSNCSDVKRYFFDFLSKEYKVFTSEYNDHRCDHVHWIQRPEEYSTDTSKNEEALIHAYHCAKDDLKFKADIIINLQPTSPIRNNFLIDQCIEEYIKGDYDSLLTGVKVTPFLWKNIKGKWKYVGSEDCCKRKMRQQINKSEFFWHDDGNIYISDAKMLLETECRIGEKPCIYEIDKIQALQIDDEDDFLLIENVIKSKKISLV